MQVMERPGIQPIVEHFGGLPAQPKKDIAEYIAGLGMAIPEIFGDLDAALASGEPFLARSEHPCELFYSDLGITLKSSRTSDVKLMQTARPFFEDDQRNFISLAHMDNPVRMTIINAESWRYRTLGGEAFKGPEADAFASQHSYSYWKAVPGHNFYMIADSARDNTYYLGHINEPRGYMTIADGSITETQSRYASEDVDWQTDPKKLVEYYEQIRSNALFDPTNVPLIEFVDPGAGSEPVFLQTLPTQQKQPVDFAVEAPSDAVFFVRGATSGDGIEVKLRMQRYNWSRATQIEHSGHLAMTLICSDKEEFEAYAPDTQVFFQPGNSSYASHTDLERRMLLLASVDHRARSQIFKPEVTIGLRKEAAERLTATDGRQIDTKEMYVIADGERAFVQFYDPKEQCIVTL